MTFEELVAQARELSIEQRKALINELIDSFTDTERKQPQPRKKRTPNLHAGQVWMSDDFNDELPD